MSNLPDPTADSFDGKNASNSDGAPWDQEIARLVNENQKLRRDLEATEKAREEDQEMIRTLVLAMLPPTEEELLKSAATLETFGEFLASLETTGEAQP